MKIIIAEFGRSIMAVIVFAVVGCCIYPLVVFGLGQLMFPHQANGSLMVDKSGTVRGSELLCQNFTSDKYFHPRPSAASAGDPTSAVSVNNYDPTHSSGSNLGPTSSNLVANITGNIAAYRSDNGMGANEPVPADAVTESASGLDPDISLVNAELQIARVARHRGMTVEQVSKLVEENTSERDLGIFGEPRVNVVKLNFELDGLEGK